MTLDHRTVQQLIIDLHQKGLALSLRSQQGVSMLVQAAEKRRQKLVQTILNPFFIRFPGINPQWLLSVVNSTAGWLFSKPAVLTSVAIIAWSLITLGIRRQEVTAQLAEFSQFFGWPNLLYLWLTLGVTKIVHEIGHGLACIRFGRQCSSIGLALLVFSPTLYCDATDSWMLRSKWQRILVSSAGMYAEVLLASLAILTWAALNDGLLRHLCMNVFLVSTVTTVLFNANPLIRFDGYYILADALEIPNLRQKATQLLNRWLAWAFAAEQQPDRQLPATGRFWFVVYALASSVYRWLIVLGIFAFLVNVLKPYRLQSLGIGWAVVSGCLMLFGVGRSLWKAITMKTGHPRNKRRLLITVAVIAGLVIAILQIPVPFVVASPFVVRARVEESAFVVEPGAVDSIHCAAGQRVLAGEPLLTLSNPDLIDYQHQLTTELEITQSTVQTARAASDHHQVVLQRQKADQLRRELDETNQRLRELIVRAPIDGRVTAVPRLRQPTVEQQQENLTRWTGQILSETVAGAWLEAGTSVATIAGSTECQAELAVDQSNLREIHPGQKVRLSLDSDPGTVLIGRVVEIAAQHVEFIEPSLSNKFGGSTPTTTDRQGREKLSSHAYQVLVSLPPNQTTPVIGMRGRARVIVSEYTLGHWAWRALRTTFRYRM